jgi:hypothetical protein
MTKFAHVENSVVSKLESCRVVVINELSKRVTSVNAVSF